MGAHPRIRFDIYANTYLGVYALSDAVRADLDRFNGTLTTIKASITLENELDFETTEQGVNIYRVMQDYFVNHLET